MSHKSLNYKIVGVSPLVMHNGQLADPLNEFSIAIKKISGKRNKTEADYSEMARLEWYGGLYLNNGKPCIPGYVLEAVLVGAAKRTKQGKQATAGLFCPNNYELYYKDEAEVDELWKGKKHYLSCLVRVQNARLMRTRPLFNDWWAEVEVVFDDKLLNEREVDSMVTLAGENVGLMEWRPKYGRFEVEK